LNRIYRLMETGSADCFRQSQPGGCAMKSFWGRFGGPTIAVVIAACGSGASALAQEKAARADFTLRSVKSGPRSAPDTWNAQRVPREGDRVLIGRKTRVLFDVDSPAVIRYLQVAGVLSFARDRNTTLNVGVITIQATEEYAETGFDCHAPVKEGGHQ